ncbi:hypothetical protein H4S06_006617, partial [Coemansia sp. BCRC 34490]
EFSTHTAETNEGRLAQADGSGGMAADTQGELFLARANEALRIASRASSRHTAHQRPGSQHSAPVYGEAAAYRAPRSAATTPGIADAEYEDNEEEEERLPTFSSPHRAAAVRPPALTAMASMVSIDLTRPPFLAADSGSTVNDGAENRYARLVARYSGTPQQQQHRLQPAAAGRILADHLADDLSSEALSMDALPDTPGINAAGGFSSDQMSPASSPGMKAPGGIDRARQGSTPTYSPQPEYVRQERPSATMAAGAYYNDGDGSFESLEHPNMGSQGSPLSQAARGLDGGYSRSESRGAYDMDGLLFSED